MCGLYESLPHRQGIKINQAKQITTASFQLNRKYIYIYINVINKKKTLSFR